MTIARDHAPSHNGSPGVKNVLITGCSSGIGRALAQVMARRGWRVFAGVRLVEHAPPGTTPVLLDVTNANQIRAAREVIQATAGRLDALVNNAGIPYGGPVECLDLERVRQLYEVNVFGVLGVTKEFVPLLRAAEGRVLNIGSVSGLVAMPFLSPYASSKFALAAINDSLRVELNPWNIKVIDIVLGDVRTPVWEKASRHLDEMTPLLDRYAAFLPGVRKLLQPRGTSPQRVARALARILEVRRPSPRYFIGWPSRMALLLSWLPRRVRDWLMRTGLALGSNT